MPQALTPLGERKDEEDGNSAAVIEHNTFLINSTLATIYDNASLRTNPHVNQFLRQRSVDSDNAGSAGDGAEDWGGDGITVVHPQSVDACACSALANVLQLRAPPAKAQLRELAVLSEHPHVDNPAVDIDHGAVDVMALVLRRVLGGVRVHMARKGAAFSGGWKSMLSAAYRADDPRQTPTGRSDFDRVLLLNPGHWVALRAAVHAMDGEGYWLMDSLAGPQPTAARLATLDVHAQRAEAVVCWLADADDATAVQSAIDSVTGRDG